MRVHAVHRPSAAHRCGQHASAEWIWSRWRVCLVQKHPELADELGRRRGWIAEWNVARGWLHEDGAYAPSGERAHQSNNPKARRYPDDRKARRIVAFHTSLHGLQYLRAIEFTEQTVFLRIGERFDAVGSFRLRHGSNHCWWECDQAGV